MNVLRESSSSSGLHQHLTSHIQIPAAYLPGITLYVRKDSSTYKELLEAPELPFVQEENTTKIETQMGDKLEQKHENPSGL